MQENLLNLTWYLSLLFWVSSFAMSGSTLTEFSISSISRLSLIISLSVPSVLNMWQSNLTSLTSRIKGDMCKLTCRKRLWQSLFQKSIRFIGIVYLLCQHLSLHVTRDWVPEKGARVFQKSTENDSNPPVRILYQL